MSHMTQGTMKIQIASFIKIFSQLETQFCEKLQAEKYENKIINHDLILQILRLEK